MNKKFNILVFTVASWNDKQGSNTWASLLKDIPKERIANICIRDEKPNSNVCSRYFVISENRILKSILNRKIKTGHEVEDNNSVNTVTDDLTKHNKRYTKLKKNRRYSLLLCREVAWKIGKWKSKELDDFLDDFHPDIILHSMEGYIHLNRIVEYAIKRTGAKSIGYIWDDNFTYKQSKRIGFKIYRWYQRKSLISLASKTQDFLAISETTKEEADDFFDINCTVLTKPLSSKPVLQNNQIVLPIKMLYTGKLIIGRDKTLERIINVLEKINKSGIKFKIDVYTNTIMQEEDKKKIQCKFCTVHPPVSQKKVLELQKTTDILLFLEDIDGPDAYAARLSFSTKITDYLSSGKCILAVGNKDTAPMKYFIKNDAAIVAYDDKTIEKELEKLITYPQRIKDYAKKAMLCGSLNHDERLIVDKFNEILIRNL